jgi:polyphenol oxidase
LQKIDSGGPVYYKFDQWADSSALAHGVFTRLGGVSFGPFDSLNVGGTVGDDPAAVQTNALRIFDALELDFSASCTVWQVHSADVVVADERAPGRRWLARADGMVTDQVGVPLTMRFADCVPILFHDPVKNVIGVAHAGWRGTVGEVTRRTVETMQAAYGCDPADVQAAIGPSIGPDHYQVGPEVVEAARNTFGTTDGIIQYADDGSAYFNLWETNRLALERAGVRQVEVAGISTADHTDEWYSHRAEHGKTGRFCAVIALKER